MSFIHQETSPVEKKRRERLVRIWQFVSITHRFPSASKKFWMFQSTIDFEIHSRFLLDALLFSHHSVCTSVVRIGQLFSKNAFSLFKTISQSTTLWHLKSSYFLLQVAIQFESSDHNEVAQVLKWLLCMSTSKFHGWSIQLMNFFFVKVRSA